jgi:F0F1-type ATP synthase membrane subunit b/b'
MRMIFGLLSLLLALAIVGYVVKTQLKAVTVAPVTEVPATEAPAATPAQQSQQIQRQVQDDIARAMQQGADRAASAAP